MSNLLTSTRARLGAAGALLLAAMNAGAADYPSRPVQLVSPVTAGSAADGLARTVGQALARVLGQPVVIENKPGAEGAIAAKAVAASPADGYSVLFAGTGTLAVPLLVKPPPFDPLADFAAVSTIGRPTYGLFVHGDLPAASLKDFVAYARAQPGRLNYASVNLSMDMAATQLMKATGTELVKIPYKGGAQAMTDLVAGRVHLFFGPLGNGLGHVKEGRLRLLAVHPDRSPLAPETPTVSLAGAPIAFQPLYYLLLVPAKTDRHIVDKLSKATQLALQEERTRSELGNQALAVHASTPQEAARTLAQGVQAWSEFFAAHPHAGK